MRQIDPPTAPRAAVLLDCVYDALLTSDYALLDGLSASLERELQNPSAPMTENGLQVIRHKAVRNAALLMAAQRGIRSARRRLSEIRTTAGGLVTYDRGGRRAEVGQGRNLTQRL